MSTTFDEVLKTQIGTFGKYQMLIVLLISVQDTLLCLTSMSTVFITDTPEYHCVIPEKIQTLNCSDDQIKEYAIPAKTVNGKAGINQCSLFSKIYENLTEVDVCPGGETSTVQNLTETSKCDSWTYDTSEYESTIVTEFNLVCDRSWLTKNTAGLYMAARIVGVIVIGWLGDRFGRRSVSLVAGFVHLAAFTLQAFMPTYTAIMVCKVVEGFISLGYYSLAYVLATEIVGPNHRNITRAISLLGWEVGFLLLALVGYFFTNWRHLMMAIGGIHLVLSCFYAIIAPESPRWLMLNGRNKEALTILRRMAKANGRDPDMVDISGIEMKLSPQGSKKATPLQLLRTPNMRMVTFILSFAWFVVGYVYYGIVMNIQDLGGSVYINLIISFATEVPGVLLLWWLPRHFGRVVLSSLFLVICAVSLFLVAAVPVGHDYPVIVLAMMGKFFDNLAFCLMYLLSAEIYPTNIRGLGLTLNSSAARIGATVGVYAGLLIEVHRALPQIVYAIPALAIGLLVLALPETKGITLSQTIEESEEFISKNSFKICKHCKNGSEKKDQNCIDVDESFLPSKTAV